jgi:hypothetical protein
VTAKKENLAEQAQDELEKADECRAQADHVGADHCLAKAQVLATLHGAGVKS